MALVLYSAPATEPVDTAEAKKHLRVTHTEDDVYIQQLVVAARKWIEDFTRRVFVTQTWDLYLDCGLDKDLFKVPLAPLQSVTHIKYIDLDGVEQTLSASVYSVDNKSQPGRISLAYNQSWPSVRDVINNVNIRFVAGYGTAEKVPDEIMHAIKILVAHWFENREPVVTGTIVSDIPLSVESLLWPFRVDLP